MLLTTVRILPLIYNIRNKVYYKINDITIEFCDFTIDYINIVLYIICDITNLEYDLLCNHNINYTYKKKLM